MRFVVTGSGTSTPHPDRGPAGFLVHVGARAWLVDGGSGTLQRCARLGVDARALAGGFYTHRHPDHTGNLVPLLFAMHTPPARRTDYPIYAGAGFQVFLDGLRAVYGASLDLAPGASTVVTELPLTGPSTVDLGDLVVRARPAVHAAGALHFRFEADDRVVVFSGDTGPSADLVVLADRADLLVCECAGSDEAPVPNHLTPSAIAELVDAAHPAEVWLTHLFGHVDADRAVATIAATGVRVRRAEDLDAWGVTPESRAEVRRG